MENDFNSQFKKIKESVKLSEQEMDFHRGEIVKFMDRKPSSFKRKIRSPFYLGFFFQKHFIATGLVAVLIFSTGITVSADSALPNDYFYQIKTKITEPVLLFLTPNLKSRTSKRVALVERRLQEYSQVVLNGETLSPEDKISFTNQLSLQIKQAHEGISQLVKEESLPDALETTNDLQSVLAAQDTILEKIHEVNPDAENTDEVTSVITESIESTTTIENNITETVQISTDETELDNSIASQKEEITKSLEGLQEENQRDASEENKDKLDVVNQTNIDSKISEINLLIEEADKKVVGGEKKKALELYNQIDQDLGEIESLIHVEQKLQIDDSVDSDEPKDQTTGEDLLPIDLENLHGQE
ncbi:hypothetical protein HYW73_03960 [Candidatus Nomurabacteria bacterium]|nr:hypothetical protein [Candidatus Nomurabacteria bacterium]